MDWVMTVRRSSKANVALGDGMFLVDHHPYTTIEVPKDDNTRYSPFLVV